MKKICIFDTVEFKKNGVSEIIMNTISENEKENKFEFTLVVNGEMDSYYKRILSDFGLVIKTLPHRKEKYIHYLKEIKKFFKENSFDLIHVHTNNALATLDLYAIGKSKKIVQCHQDKTNHPNIHALIKPLFNRSFDLGIAVGPETGKLCFNEQNYILLPNPIDTNKFLFSQEERETYRRRNGYSDSDIVLLSVGRLEDQKNYEYELEVFKSLQNLNTNYKLIIIGDGSKKDYLKRIVSNKRIDGVRFINSVDDVAPYYSMSDFFLLLSTHEALGLVIIEAQINGLTSIASKAISEMTIVSDYYYYIDINKPHECTAEDIDEIVLNSNAVFFHKKNSVDSRIDPYKKGVSFDNLISTYYKILKDGQEKL